MLSERITLVMSVLNAENADIAQIAGFDQSNVSRMRSGARVPPKNGTSIGKFMDAAIDLALKTGKGEALCKAVGYDGEFSRESFRTSLLEWLYEDSGLPESQMLLPDPEAGLYFSKKLSTLMDTVGISNVKLSKAVSIDPSYLSRMRTGKHLPKENSKVLERICDVLIRRTIDKNELWKLSEAVNIPEKHLAAQPRLLAEWLLSSKETAYRAPVGQLIEKIGAMDQLRQVPIPPLPTDVLLSAETDDSREYLGISGLQKAVIRFLWNNAKSGGELLLYSDQSMSWMSGSYKRIWLSLMAEVLKKGVRIKIIHNIDRSSSEMLEAIASWLPLYMTGQIEPYYCMRRKGERFAATFFMAKDQACITGCCVAGFENDCAYSYITDKDRLKALQLQFENILADSRPLVQISRDVPAPSKNGLIKTIDGVRMDISEKKAVLSKLTSPTCSFHFDHPLLLGAFRHFIL